ncbi:nuclear transport factor 2 family protein [Phytohabitans sp. LJ34]|uniref:nuclear transport factor 2 family protein n=1 Tax=Phytohabitans sp. LJ34 TaxID=3452217 RepID=UPI003F8BA187
MTSDLSPREVFLRLVHGVCEGRWAELPDLYAERTHVTHPFHPLGAPALRDREEIRAHFAAAGSSGVSFDRRPANITIHETADPEVIVAEFEYRGAVGVPCVFVLRVRDGEIVESRDYIHHLASARARGQLAPLLATLASTPA